MTGKPKLNHPAFNKSTRRLRRKGYKVINPAELDGGAVGMKWVECLRRDLKEIVKRCDKIALLPGWMWSRGARLEVLVGYLLGFEIHYVQYWMDKK